MAGGGFSMRTGAGNKGSCRNGVRQVAKSVAEAEGRAGRIVCRVREQDWTRPGERNLDSGVRRHDEMGHFHPPVRAAVA